MQVKGLREIVLIHDLKKQGLSVSAIARKVGCDRRTVRKYLAPSEGFFVEPRQGRTKPEHGLLRGVSDDLVSC